MSAAGLALWAVLAPAGPIVVVPPEAPSGAATVWIRAAVAEMLPRALQRIGVPAVSSADRRRAQEALGVPGPVSTRATSIRVGESLGASRLVVGSWSEGGSEVTLSLRLLDPGRGSLSAPLTGTAPLSGLLGLLGSLAWDVALSGPHAPAGTRDTPQRAASALRLDALRALSEGLSGRDAAAQIVGARRALALDPGFDEAALLLARLLVDASAFAEARGVLAGIPGSSAFAREARFLDGVALLGLGRDREADALYASLGGEAPVAALLSNRAAARLRLGSGASTLLRQAVAVAPAATDLPCNLGWALLVEGDTQAAAFWLRGAVRRDPSDAQARLLLSWALTASARPAEAEEQWKAATALTPALEGMRAPDLSRRLERIFVSEHALMLDPEHEADAEEARAHVARAEASMAAQDLAGAVAELTRATLLDPFVAGAHRLLARARRAQGDDERAIAELQAALWCREDPVVRRELVELLRSAGRAGDAAP